MAKGGKIVPVGLKKVEKGRHSEKSTYKSPWCQLMIYTPSGWVGGPKFLYPRTPGCSPAGNKWIDPTRKVNETK